VEDSFGATHTVTTDVEILPLPIPVITRPKNGDTVFENIDIEGTASGDTVTHVQVFLKKQGSTSGTLIDTVGVTNGKWSTSWDTKAVENGNYDLTARASDKDGKYRSEESSSIRIKIDNEVSIIDDGPDDQPEDNVTSEWWDVLGLGTMCIALCLILVVVIIIAIVAIMRRGRGARGKRPPAEALAAAQRDMYERMGTAGAMAEEELGFEEITDEEEEEPEVEDEGMKRPVRCPSCNEIFISKDKGERPWMLFCTQCGAKGIIKEERLKLPPGKEDEEEEEPEEKRERKREKVRCPECEEIFSVWEDEKDLECPNCGVTGMK
jgi:hypothetical protein